MITDRWLQAEDLPALAASLAKDEYHKNTTPDFFLQPGTACKVYEDEKGPIMFVRGTKALRMDIQFFDNNDSERNREVMITQFPAFVEKVKEHGFTELIFCTDSRALRAFCKRQFKFKEVEGELRKFI